MILYNHILALTLNQEGTYNHEYIMLLMEPTRAMRRYTVIYKLSLLPCSVKGSLSLSNLISMHI